ncbi:hypothetical protein LDENG_00001970 [Lucifuga dentata]|nr:hypothetical protein LDENG_00001970 [Lucifuga dentata]
MNRRAPNNDQGGQLMEAAQPRFQMTDIIDIMVLCSKYLLIYYVNAHKSTLIGHLLTINSFHFRSCSLSFTRPFGTVLPCL